MTGGSFSTVGRSNDGDIDYDVDDEIDGVVDPRGRVVWRKQR